VLTRLSPSNFRYHWDFLVLYLLATHLALDELPGKRGDQREHNGVCEVNRHRRSTWREAEEDTGDQEVEQSNEEEKLDVHLFTFR